MIETPKHVAGGQVAGGQVTGATLRDERPAAARLNSVASTGSTADMGATTLDSAMAQLSALRNLATAAAANGNVSDLRQLAERAVAVGLAAGAQAESLSGEIAAKLAIATQSQNGAAASPTSRTSDGQSALGLDPAVITQAFEASQQDDPTSSDPAASQPPGAATDLNTIASLNYRASAVITEARSLLASMNAAFKDARADGGTSPVAGPTAGGQEAVSLNGLAGLLDQAESSLTTHTLGLSRQISSPAVASAAPSAATGDKTVAPVLDLST